MNIRYYFKSTALFLALFTSMIVRSQGSIPMQNNGFSGALEFLPNGKLANTSNRIHMPTGSDTDPLLNSLAWYGSGTEQMRGMVGDAVLFFEWWTTLENPIERFKFDWTGTGYFELKYFDKTGTLVEKRITRQSLVKYPNLLELFDNLCPTNIGIEMNFQSTDYSAQELEDFKKKYRILDDLSAAGFPSDYTRKIDAKILSCLPSGANQEWVSPGITEGGWNAFLNTPAQFKDVDNRLSDLFKLGKTLRINSFRITEISWNLSDFIYIARKFDEYESNTIRSDSFEQELQNDLKNIRAQQKAKNDLRDEKIKQLNRQREEEFYQLAMNSLDKRLLELYLQKMGSLDNDRGISVNKEIEKHNNPNSFLETDIEKDLAKELKYLFELGADPNWTNGDQESLLHLCVKYNAVNCFAVLNQMKIPLEQFDSKGNTPLIQAIIEQKTNMVEALLAAGASTETANKQSNQSPFCYAIINNLPKMGELLIQKGVNPNSLLSYQSQQSLPLCLTIKHSETTEFALTLLQNGAKIDELGPDQLTALMTAVQSNKPKFVNFLLQMGAAINQKGIDQKTALHLAVEAQNTGMTSYLIQRGAADKTLTDAQNRTALQLAGSNKELYKIVKKQKALINPATEKNLHEQQYLLRSEQIQLESFVNKLKRKRNTRLMLSAGLFATCAVLVKIQLSFPKPPENDLQKFFPFVLGGVGGPAAFGAFATLAKASNKSNPEYVKAKARIKEIKAELKKIGL